MPKRCVPGGCSRGTEAGISLHTFPKDPIRRAQWSQQVALQRVDWTGPTDHSVICNLHFNRECFETFSLLTGELGLPSKKRILKPTAIPTLWPKSEDLLNTVYKIANETGIPLFNRYHQANPPLPLSSTFESPSKSEAIAAHHTRFSIMAVIPLMDLFISWLLYEWYMVYGFHYICNS